jgi:hypothetical protein
MFLKKFSTSPEDFHYYSNIFLPNYEKVKFITHSVYKHFAIFRKEYSDMFGTDITDDFPYATRSLESLKITKIDKEKITFNANDEKQLYVPLLFFAGREAVLNKLQ